ncbi:MAG: hypothetical protein JWM74_5640 [Myxococcaceae bacterium]|nr:hypothetical protein [Myxococcaceae bacterium]
MNKAFPILMGVMCLAYVSGCSLLKKKNKDAGVDLSAMSDPAAETATATETAAPVVTASAVPVAVAFKVGAHGQVLWKGTWYAASIIGIAGTDKYKIHYDGYESSWDEVVGPSRMKGFGGSATTAAATAGGGGGGGGTTTKAVVAADAPCPGPGLTRRCGGRCVNIQTDDNNCGSCGTSCSGGKHCDGHMFCRDSAGNL